MRLLSSRFVIALVTLVVCLFGAWIWLGKSDAPVPVEVVKSRGGKISSWMHVSGVVHSKSTVHLTSRISAPVTSLHVKVGEKIKRGELLVKMDDSDAISDVKEQRLKVEETRLHLVGSREKLRERKTEEKWGGSSRNAVLEAKRMLSNDSLALSKAENRLNAMEEGLRQYQVIAPIDGIITERNINDGEYVQSGTLLLTMADDESREILVKVEPEDVSSLRLGMTALVSVAGSSSQPLREKVVRIEPSVKKEGDSRYLPVWVSAESDASSLRLNQQVDVDIETDDREVAVRLPLEAVISRDGRDQVWMIQKGRLVRVPVKLGIVGDRHVEIIEGLEPGDEVVLLEGRELKEGDAVTISKYQDVEQ